MKMHFPEIIKELEKKKNTKIDQMGSILTAITYNKTDDTFGVYTNKQLEKDPFIKSMMTRLKKYISNNYPYDK